MHNGQNMLHYDIQKLFVNSQEKKSRSKHILLSLLIPKHNRYGTSSLKTFFCICVLSQDKQIAMTSAGHNSEIHKKEIYFCIIIVFVSSKFGINSPKILKHSYKRFQSKVEVTEKNPYLQLNQPY